MFGLFLEWQRRVMDLVKDLLRHVFDDQGYLGVFARVVSQALL